MTGKEAYKKEYRELVIHKEYCEMSSAEKGLCIDIETELIRPYVEKLRRNGVEDYIISAYITDLFDDYLIFDDVPVTDAFGISDDDYEKGKEYLWSEMEEENPLIGFNKIIFQKGV